MRPRIDTVGGKLLNNTRCFLLTILGATGGGGREASLFILFSKNSGELFLWGSEREAPSFYSVPGFILLLFIRRYSTFNCM